MGRRTRRISRVRRCGWLSACSTLAHRSCADGAIAVEKDLDDATEVGHWSDFIEGDSDGWSAALLAAKHGNKAVLQRLRQLGRSCYSFWSQTGGVVTLDVCLLCVSRCSGARLDGIDPEGKTVLHHIVDRKDLYDFRDLDVFFDHSRPFNLRAVVRVVTVIR